MSLEAAAEAPGESEDEELAHEHDQVVRVALHVVHLAATIVVTKTSKQSLVYSQITCSHAADLITL